MARNSRRSWKSIFWLNYMCMPALWCPHKAHIFWNPGYAPYFGILGVSCNFIVSRSETSTLIYSVKFGIVCGVFIGLKLFVLKSSFLHQFTLNWFLQVTTNLLLDYCNNSCLSKYRLLTPRFCSKIKKKMWEIFYFKNYQFYSLNGSKCCFNDISARSAVILS